PGTFERENVQLAHVLSYLQDLPDLLLEDVPGLELVTITDRRRDLSGERDRAVLQVLLDQPAAKTETQGGEAERRDDDDGDAQEDQLVPAAQAHDSPHIPERRAPRAGRADELTNLAELIGVPAGA